MTIQEVVSELQREKQSNVPSRFPCRAIMVKNIHQYCELLSELKKISDIHVVQTQELFTNAAVMPTSEKLKDAKYQDKWIVLTGVSEYLRLFSKNESTDRRFSSLWSYQAPASSTGRIIIPLWGCEAQWFDKALNLAGDLRQQDFYYDCSDAKTTEQNLRLLVLSGMFERYIPKLDAMKGDLKIGLQDWFDYWTDPVADKEEFVLLTRRANSVNTINGSISIHVISDVMTLIQESMEGSSILSKENCSEGMQSILLEYALRGVSLEDALLNIMNVSSFSGIDVMGKWKAMDANHKKFVKLWFTTHPDSTYLSHCFAVESDVAKLPNTIMLEIFNVWAEKTEWIQEYRNLMQVMGIVPDAKFTKKLDAIPVYEKRLEFMVGSSRFERIYLLHMVGGWLRQDRAQVMASTKLQQVYPELFAYLKDENLPIDSEIKQYMAGYKSYKLENTLPEDEDTYFNGIQTDAYDMRYSILSDYIDADTIVLWVDALGIEWLPLLYWTISQNCDATIKKVDIGQANLPTETEFNDQWNYMQNPHKKLDKLDKLAHKGVVDEPDYYACVQDQLEFVSGLHSKISELMEEYHRVIVTGDHGTSRLAARFFHNRDGMDIPSGATVCSHGRYCRMQNGTQIAMSNIRKAQPSDGNMYAVFTNYDHFKQSGFAAGADDENAIYGEVHGGATPEEMLVPVIVLDSNQDIPLFGSWEKDTVKISMKKVRLTIIFNKPVNTLQVHISGVTGDAVCQPERKRWTISFAGIKQGTYSPHIVADNKIIAMSDVTIKPALGGGEGDLP